MTHVEAIQSLRISQAIFTVVNLALASYLFQCSTQDTQYPTGKIAISLVAACTSAIGVCYVPAQGDLLRRSPKLFVAFGVDWLVAFINLAALAALAVFTSKSQYCQSNTCMLVKVNAVFTGFNFVNWTATAAFLGIQLSRPATSVYRVVPLVEKVQY